MSGNGLSIAPVKFAMLTQQLIHIFLKLLMHPMLQKADYECMGFFPSSTVNVLGSILLY